LILTQAIAQAFAGILLLAAFGSNPLPWIVKRSAVDLNQTEQQVYRSVNQERRSGNLCELKWNVRIAEEARRHAARIAEDSLLSHQDPLRGDIERRLDKSGIGWIRCGENLYRGNYSNPAEDAVQCWISSSGHRRNMMDAMFNETGVGVALRSDGWIVIVQEFITRQTEIESSTR
jgi:uncharacterized protein YkwD